MGVSATVEEPWQRVLLDVLRAMHREGFAARRSFDLQLARKSLRHGAREPCPHHGTAACTCQYLVLQVDGGGRSPGSLVFHGFERTTRVTLLPPVEGEVERRLAAVVFEALDHARAGAGGNDVA